MGKFRSLRRVMLFLCIISTFESVESLGAAIQVVGVAINGNCNDPINAAEACNSSISLASRPCSSSDLSRATAIYGIPTPDEGGKLIAYTFLPTPVAVIGELNSQLTIVDDLGKSYAISNGGTACGYYIRYPNGSGQYEITTGSPTANAIGGVMCCQSLDSGEIFYSGFDS